jgi:TPR repeat protein
MHGCTRLGALHERGAGVALDTAKAAALYQKACDGDDMLGCSQLGLLSLRSEGPAHDPVKSAELLDKACNGGDARGCSGLAAVYQEQHKDIARIVPLYQKGKACDAGC